MLERNEKGLRSERIYVMILWPVYVVICAAFIWVGSARAGTPMSAFFAGLACFWLVFAAIELLKYFINRARVEVLKEIKRVELEVLQLREQLGGKGA